MTTPGWLGWALSAGPCLAVGTGAALGIWLGLIASPQPPAAGQTADTDPGRDDHAAPHPSPAAAGRDHPTTCPPDSHMSKD